jgi:hypothetical protein
VGSILTSDLQVKSPDIAHRVYPMRSSILRRTAIIYPCRIKRKAFLMGGHCCLSELSTDFFTKYRATVVLMYCFIAQAAILQHVTAESRVGARPVHVRYTLDAVSLGLVLFFIRVLWFRLSVSFHCCSVHIFILMLLSPQDQLWKHGDLETKQCSLGYGGPLEEKVLASCIVFRGLIL